MPFADPPRSWLFAYGSLLPAGATALPPAARPCRLLGWRRFWGVAMDNRVDLPGYKHFVAPDGERPAVMVAFLDVAPHAGASVNGAALPVSDDELVGLDAARERLAAGRREARLAIASSYYERVLAGFEALGQPELFARLTAPAPAPVVDLEVVLAAPRAEPGSAG